jgi:hypothetical protein
MVVDFIHDLLKLFDIKELSKSWKSEQLNKSEQSYVFTKLLSVNEIGDREASNKIDKKSLLQVMFRNQFDVGD